MCVKLLTWLLLHSWTSLSAGYCLIDAICYADGTNQTGTECNYCDVGSDQFDWSLNPDYCLIDSVCYMNGTTKSGNTCKYCHVTFDTADWTTDNGTASCLATDDEEEGGLEGHIIAVIVIFTLLGVAGIVAAGYVIKKKVLTSKSARLGLFDTPKNNKFAMRVEPLTEKSWKLTNDDSPALPKLYAEPTPGTEDIPDNLYTEGENLTRSDTLVPAMPWGQQTGRVSPHTETISIGNQQVPRTPSPAPAAPWNKPE